MKFKLDIITSDLYQIKNILRSLIHTILFCRILISIKPEVVECTIFNLTYVKIKNDKLDKKIEDYINEIYDYIDSNKSVKLCNINLFLNYINTKSWLKSKISWEEWSISIQINRLEKMFKDDNTLHYVIKKIIELSDNNYDIPPIFSSDLLSVEDYFEIDIVYDKQTFGKTAMNMLKTFSTDFPSFSFI
jgi:hypothetical protein